MSRVYMLCGHNFPGMSGGGPAPEGEVNSKEVGNGEGDLGVAEVGGVCDGEPERIEKGESGLVDPDVDEREVGVCLGESSKEIGLVGIMREVRRGLLWKPTCTGLDSSLIFFPRSIITIG